MKYLSTLLLVIFALIATSYFAREANAEPGALAEAEPGPFHKKHITSNAKNGRVIITKLIETEHKPYKKIRSQNYEKSHAHGSKSGKTHGHDRKKCFGGQCPYKPGKIHPLTTIAPMIQPTVTSDATVSPSNSTDATESTDGNIGSNDATTGFTQINTESSDADTSSTEVNMELTETEAGSTKINTETTAANTSPTGANTESTINSTQVSEISSTQVSEISSTQATSGSTAATTTANPVLSLAEVLNSSSAVYIRNVVAGYMITNASTSDEDRRFVFVRTIPGPTSESCWKLVSAQDGNPNHFYIKNLQGEILYTSIYEKATFKIGNGNNAVQCGSQSNVPSNSICTDLAHFPYVWIPGEESPEEVQNIIPVSDNVVKIFSIYDNRTQYASDGDYTSVIASGDATYGNLLWSFERCVL